MQCVEPDDGLSRKRLRRGLDSFLRVLRQHPLSEFYALDKALRRSKENLVLDTGNIRPEITASTTIMAYRFNEGTIIRKSIEEHFTVHVRVSGFPECAYADKPATNKVAVYFILDKNGKIASEIDKALGIVLTCTGIKITDHDTGFDYTTLAAHRKIETNPYAYEEVLNEVKKNSPADALIGLPILP